MKAEAAHPPSRAALSDVHKGTLAGVVVVLCWSGFNIVSRFGSTGAFTPFDLAALRYAVSGLIALPLFVWLVRPHEWPRYMVLSLFGGLGYGLLVYSGFKFAPSAHAGVFVNGGIPFWTVIMLAVGAGFRAVATRFCHFPYTSLRRRGARNGSPTPPALRRSMQFGGQLGLACSVLFRRTICVRQMRIKFHEACSTTLDAAICCCTRKNGLCLIRQMLLPALTIAN